VGNLAADASVRVIDAGLDAAGIDRQGGPEKKEGGKPGFFMSTIAVRARRGVVWTRARHRGGC
jgi:hypothetical protein